MVCAFPLQDVKAFHEHCLQCACAHKVLEAGGRCGANLCHSVGVRSDHVLEMEISASEEHLKQQQAPRI